MKILSKVIVGTTCVTIFAGTSYVVAVTLAPPPSYTVSNRDRILSYDRLSVNNAYENKTKSQEFLLGLSRWRRRMLKEEAALTGRVLEVGAGCGGNISYYPHNYFLDDGDIQTSLREWLLGSQGGRTSSGPASTAAPDVATEGYTSAVLQRMQTRTPCDEIILCDRSPGMVEACTIRIKNKLGYIPYRYPDYDPTIIREAITSRQTAQPDAQTGDGGGCGKVGSSFPVRKRKIVHDDGTVQHVLSTPLEEPEQQEFVMCTHGNQDHVIAPILRELSPGDRLPLLSQEGEREVAGRGAYISCRQSLRLSVESALQFAKDRILHNRREAHVAVGIQLPSKNLASEAAKTHPQQTTVGEASSAPASAATSALHSSQAVSIPSSMMGEDGRHFVPQPLFSVANYAAEQLPFPDHSFDTVVDMFGLCSYDDPVRALQELSRVCKPGGKLLLIEHGRGHSGRVNSHLDKWAPRHASKWGCWWNRDIRRVIRLSGLTVEKWDNKHFGTSHYIVARPFKTMDEWDAYVERQRSEEHSH